MLQDRIECMFRSIVFLIAGNVVSRAFYTVAILVLAETYSPDIFSEIIFSKKLFFSF